jgi:hypothetical protein
MLFALGAASSALDALQSLTAKKATSTPTTGLTQNSTTAFDPGSLTADSATSTAGSGTSSKSGYLSPSTMSALLAAQGQSSGTAATSTSTSQSDALKDLFAQLDGNGDGQISKSEFEDKLGAGGTNVANADKVFDKLDKDGDGSVSLDELTSALKSGGKGHHNKVANSDSSNSAGASADGATDPLLQALQGASSTSTTNSNGTTTTALTYADGSTVSMTSAVSGSSSSSAATSSYNFIEQMIQRQAQAISAQASSALSVSV